MSQLLHHLIFDTGVWRSLAVSEFSLLLKIEQLIASGKVKIVVPETVRVEWDRVKKNIPKQIIAEIVKARKSAISLFSLVDGLEVGISDQIQSIKPEHTGAEISAKRIEAVEAIIDSENTIRIVASEQMKALAIEHAMRKNEP